MLTLARILLTLTVLGYGFATIKVDLNKTHAANPAWTPHARFHVVWQILSYTGIGVISLYLIWIAGATSIKPLYLAAAISVAIYAGFFTAVFARPLFQGGLHDANGYPPYQPPFGPKHWRWDANVTVFTGMSLILLAAIILLIEN
jgi:hypothetical protein